MPVRFCRPVCPEDVVDELLECEVERDELDAVVGDGLVVCRLDASDLHQPAVRSALDRDHGAALDFVVDGRLYAAAPIET
jgi:hypothetical protein